MERVVLNELIAAIGARAAGPVDASRAIVRVSTDSRTLRAGDLFWALHGTRHDAHEFVGEAVRKGAAASVVRHNRATGLPGALLCVDDTWQALAEFARWYRSQREALIIGVTGSVGKTTTRDLIHAVLSVRHTGCRSQGNFNNEVGLPLSLLELRTEDEFGVFELGAARIGDISALCRIAAPEVGVITRIGPAHLETFGSLENVYQGKWELIDALPRHGFAIVGGDDARMRELARKATCNVIPVGELPFNRVRAVDVEFHSGHLQFTVDHRRFELSAPARHYLTAALCALALAREIGMETDAIADGFARFAGVPGRCQVEQVGDWTVIDDSYNANPLSMEAACQCLRDWPAPGQRLLIAGDMLELGPEADRRHRELGACVAATSIDRLLAIGEHAPQVAAAALRSGMRPHAIADCRDLESLLAVLDCWLEPGDVILVKGSRGMRMERVVQWLKQQGAGRGRELPAGVAARAVA